MLPEPLGALMAVFFVWYSNCVGAGCWLCLADLGRLPWPLREPLEMTLWRPTEGGWLAEPEIMAFYWAWLAEPLLL